MLHFSPYVSPHFSFISTELVSNCTSAFLCHTLLTTCSENSQLKITFPLHSISQRGENVFVLCGDKYLVSIRARKGLNEWFIVLSKYLPTQRIPPAIIRPRINLDFSVMERWNNNKLQMLRLKNNNTKPPTFTRAH